MYRLSNFFTIVSLLVSLLAPASSVLASSPEAPAAASEPICGSPTTLRLLSDQNVDTGTVTLSNSENNLFVTYTTNANYKLTSAQVAVASTLVGIPKTNKGNPVPGQFAYQATLSKVSTYTFTIPLSGLNSPFIVAAHADVLKSGSTKPLGAWGEGTMFNPKNRSWGMYFSYTIKPCNLPPTAVNDSYNTVEDTTLTVSAPGVLSNDSDPDGDSITTQLVASTTHGSLTLNADGSFSYSPNANYSGPDSFTYQARDSFNNLSSTATVNITVTPVNDAPVAVNDSYSVNENDTLNAGAPGVLTNDVDVDGDTLTAILVSGPSHAASFSLNADGSFSYAPNNYFSGSDSFTYKANDGALDSNIATVNISIDDVNFAPTATNDSYNTAEDTPLTIVTPGVVGNDTDPDLDPITAVKVSDPAHGSLTLNADGSFTYSPDANYNGSDSFTYKVNDGSLDSNVATVSITVDPVNDAPVANNDSYSTNEDTLLNIAAPGVLNNDSDVENDTLIATLASGPVNGTLTLNANGSFIYTPNANYNGSDSFTYKANDGTSDSSVATVNITVNPVNDAPVANNDSYSTNGAATLNVSGPGVLSNDTDVDNDTLSAVLVSGPSNADSFSLNSDGSFSYTANVGTTSDSFTYKANDGQADSNVATVTISINAAPIADAQSISTNEDTAKIVTLTGSDADDDNLSFSIVSNASHGTLGSIGAPDCSAANICSAAVTYTPNANYNGSDSFTFKVNDGHTDSAAATVSLTVDAVNDAPAAVDDSYSTDEDTPLIVPAPGVLANDSDVDGDSLTGAVVTTAAHGSLVLNANGGFSYNPDTNYTGSDSFTYRASDGVLTSNLATVNITIGAVDDDPTAVSDSATVAEDAAATAIDVLANDLNADGGPISIGSVTQPANGTVAITGGGTGLTYQPNANYCNDPPGTTPDTFTYTLTPGGSTATVSITVTCVDDPATAVNDTQTVAEDSSATTINVLTNDTDIDGGPAFTIASVTQPVNGTVVITNAGTDLTYQPNANYCNGGVPTDNFTYTLNPGGSTATVAVTVTCVNDAPTNTVPGDESVDEDTDLIFSTANGNPMSVADIDAGASPVQVTVSAINGTITPATGSGAAISGSGTSSATLTGTLTQVNAALNGLKYKGNANFNLTRGSETLTLVVNDQGNTGSGGALSDTDTVAITVNAVNDAPTALAKNFGAQANMKINGLSGLLTGATDPDTGDAGYTAVFTVGTTGATSPAGGVVSNLNTSAGSFDFDPPPGATGNVTFTYTVCDNGNPGPSLCSAPATVTVNVAGPVIWFVNPAVAGPGDGRLSNPFKFLSGNAGAGNDADDVDATGHRIFVYTGTATGGITLNSDEWLIGQGVTGAGFDTLFGITPPAGTIARPTISGTRPVIQGNVALATSDAVRGLNIQPASGTAGLTASSATSLTVNEVSVTTLNATAVSLTSSGGTISLTTVNANGGSRGILLNSTTGTFTVTGTGGTCTVANTAGCSGGVIQNMTGADDSTATPIGTGIVLNNAASVSLTRMWVHDHSNYALRGTSVNGFTLDNSVVNGTNGGAVAASAGSPFNDSSIYFTNLTGSSSISNTSITGGFSNNIKLVNTTGTLDRLTLSSVAIGANSTAEGNDGIGIEGQGASVVKVTVQNSTFTSSRGDLFQMNHIGTGTADLIFTGNTLSNNHPGIATGGGGVTLGNGSTSTFTMNLATNTFRDSKGHAVLIVKDVGTGSQLVTFTGNTIGVAAVANSGSLEGSDLKIQQAGGGTQTVLVNNNFFYQYNNDAILLQTGAGIATGGTFNATVTGNTVSNAGNNPSIGLPVQGINLNGGVTPGDTFAICAQIGGASTLKNDLDSAVGPFGGGDYRIRQRQNTTVRLPGYAGGTTDTAAVVTFVNSNNTISGSGTATASGTGGGFVGGAACPVP